MEKIKSDIQQLDLLERIQLAAWLAQQIQEEAVEKNEEAPGDWMWELASTEYAAFNASGEAPIPWEQVKHQTKK